jgi:hypothetical protein
MKCAASIPKAGTTIVPAQAEVWGTHFGTVAVNVIEIDYPFDVMCF